MVGLSELCCPYGGWDAHGVDHRGVLIPGAAIVAVADPDGLAVSEAGSRGEAHRLSVGCLVSLSQMGGAPSVPVEEICHRLLVLIVGLEAVSEASGHLAIELRGRGQVAPLGEDLCFVDVGVVAGHGLVSFGMLLVYRVVGQWRSLMFQMPHCPPLAWASRVSIACRRSALL